MKIVLLIFLISALVVFGVAYLTYRITFYSSPKNRGEAPPLPESDGYTGAPRVLLDEMMADMRKRPFELVSIRSVDGLTLYGRYYHFYDNAPIELQFHGYRGSAFRDYCGGNRMAREGGHNALVVDQRAQGMSEGKTITFGIMERLDCREWVRYIADHFGKDLPILLTGVSMGAATVLMASEMDLPGNVVGIIADSPFTSPEDIIRKVCGDVHVPADLAYPFLTLAARLFGGFGLTDADAAEAVKHAKVPILLIHGEDDRFVPCAMGREIAAANPSLVELHTFPEAGHGLSFLVDRPRYERVVRDFFARILRPEDAAVR